MQLSLNWDTFFPLIELTPKAADSDGCRQPLVCPLNQVRAGTSVRIKHLTAPPEVTHRLREMGFCEEQKIKLISQNSSIICQVCNVRLGISAQLAEKILVQPLHTAKAA